MLGDELNASPPTPLRRRGELDRDLCWVMNSKASPPTPLRRRGELDRDVC